MLSPRVVIMLCALFGSGVDAQVVPDESLPAGVLRGAQVEGIGEYRLANGLQVLLAPDEAKPTTTVNLTFRVGSRHEHYGETGMAHLLEHLLFKGTPKHPNPWGEFGRRGLQANGSTNHDRTNYYASFSANADTLRWYLGWQADAMVNSPIARADLDSEMTVVRNEMESGENSPIRILMQQTLATMYQWHNYGKSPIGARSDVENVDIAQLQAFYKRYYQPDNATVIVAGKFDAVQVLRSVAELFGPIPRPRRQLTPTYTLDPAQDGERSVLLRRVGGTALLMMAYHVMPASSPDFAAVQLLSSVLGDAPGGRLHKRLVEGALAASVFGYAMGMTEPGPLLLGAQLTPGQDVAQARAAMAAVIDGLSSNPITTEEFERARTQWLNEWELGFTDPERIGVDLSEAVGLGDWRLYFLARDQVRRLTLDDVRRVAAQYLRADNRTVGTYLPTAQPERAPAPARVDVAALLKDFKGDAAAAQVEAFEATPQNLQARTERFELASGLRVGILPKGTRGRVVQAVVRLHLGDEHSLHGQATVGAFVASLIDKGGAGLSRQQIADQFDRWRANVSLGFSGQVLTATITTTREHLPAVVARVGRLLREPDLAPEALEEVRRQRLASIEGQRKEPAAVAGVAVGRQGNPYVRGDLRHVPGFDERVQDVKAVTVAQLRSFHRRFFSAARGEFAAVGDIDLPALRQALETTFADWKQPADGPVPYVRVPRPLVAVEPVRLLLSTPDKANANLLATLALPLNDLHADYPALAMANHLFGGGDTGRLWLRIREKDGLSYDVRSGIEWNNVDLNSRWVASAIFAPQNQARVERALHEELTRSLQDGFTSKEFEEARSGLLSLRRLARAQDEVVVGQLAGNLHLGRDFMLAQRIDEAIAGLTLEQVNTAWRRYMQPSRLVQAWAGDFKP